MPILVTSILRYFGHPGECCKIVPCIICSIGKLRIYAAHKNEQGRIQLCSLSYSFPNLLVKVNLPLHQPHKKNDEETGLKWV